MTQGANPTDRIFGNDRSGCNISERISQPARSWEVAKFGRIISSRSRLPPTFHNQRKKPRYLFFEGIPTVPGGGSGTTAGDIQFVIQSTNETQPQACRSGLPHAGTA
jgi:hypothetical protein